MSAPLGVFFEGVSLVKRTVFVVMILALLMAACACDAEPTVSDAPSTSAGVVAVEELADYAIIYPSAYNSYRMRDVNTLKEDIDSLTGGNIKLIPDGEAYEGRAIIILGSRVATAFDGEVAQLGKSLGYIIALEKDTENIILGGNNYYASMLAMLDFGLNYVSSAVDAKAIKGFYKKEQLQHKLTISASNLGARPIRTEEEFRGIANCGFNSLVVDSSFYDEDEMHDLVRWCAIYNIDLIMRSIMYTGVYYDSPNVKGHLMVDEPYGENAYKYYSNVCDDYNALYSALGWRPYVNILGQKTVINYLERNPELFASVDSLSMKVEPYNIHDMVEVYSLMANYVNSRDINYIACIETHTYLAMEYKEIFESMAWLGLGSGAVGVGYFDYAATEGNSDDVTIADSEYNVNEDVWNAARELNNELRLFGDVMEGFEYKASFVDCSRDGISLFGDKSVLQKYNSIFDAKLEDKKSYTFFVGYFENKQTGEKAFMLVNLSGAIDSTLEFEVTATHASAFEDGVDKEFFVNGTVGIEGSDSVFVRIH